MSTDNKNRERFTFAIFLAAALHSALIFGITFNFEPDANGSSSLEVTIALNTSDNEPDKADFIASDNSEASGTLDEAKELTSTNTANLQGAKLTDAATPQEQLTQGSQAILAQVTTTANSQHTALDSTHEIDKAGQDHIDQERVVTSEIAALKAKLAEQQQLYSKRPRIKRLSAMSTKAAAEASYLNAWQVHVEEVGNLNYPEQAKVQRLYGELRMLVSLLPNGHLHDAKILQSSGNRVLDRAALDIVAMASPFPRFDDELSEQYDRLEVIRTWRFERGNRLTNR